MSPCAIKVPAPEQQWHYSARGVREKGEQSTHTRLTSQEQCGERERERERKRERERGETREEKEAFVLRRRRSLLLHSGWTLTREEGPDVFHTKGLVAFVYLDLVRS